MTLRASKVLLIFGVALFYTLVVLNHITDYDSNYQFMRHVMTMDTTFPGNRGMWRAMNSPAVHTMAYITIIAWEALTMALCWWGGVRLARASRFSALEFHRVKQLGIVGLTLGLIQWLVVFLSIGGEWFLMWQSKEWNGQDAAFRMFAVVGIVLLFVVLPEMDEQP